MTYEMELIDREYLARKEGREEGRAEGRVEGRAEGIEIVAMNMINKQTSFEKIYELTGLSMERIMELDRKIKNRG